jgi:ABC-type branched-subunit amino acid transport system ATPase component
MFKFKLLIGVNGAGKTHYFEQMYKNAKEPNKPIYRADYHIK